MNRTPKPTPKAASRPGKVHRPLARDAHTWPLLRAQAPWRSCWDATGCGSAAVLRRAPDGRIGLAAMNVLLMSGGLSVAFGLTLGSEAEADDFLAEMDGTLAPWEDSPVEAASAFAWGARALAESHGALFDARMDSLLRMFPRPDGAQASIVERLVGAGGMTPAALAEIVRRNYRPDLSDDGREPMIVTTMSFRVGHHARTLAALRRARPEFDEEASHEDDLAFGWSREYPRNHWSPLARLGGRQVLGSVRLARDGSLKADARSLSMAAALASKMRKLAGGDVRLERADWTDVSMMTKAGS